MDNTKVKQELLDGARRAQNPAAKKKQSVIVPKAEAETAVGADHPVLKDCRCSEHKDAFSAPRAMVEVPLAEWLDALEGKASSDKDKPPPKAA